MKPINFNTQSGTVAAAANMTSIDVRNAKGYGIFVDTTVTTATAATFTAAVTDICTAVAHGYYTGLKVAATTDTTLPSPLTATNYYVIRIDADTFKLATSAANALAGTAINITDTGTGIHTLTPAALAGASYKLQASMDDTNFFDLSVTNNVTTTAQFIHEKVDPMFNYVRVVWTMTAGQIAYNLYTVVKE